jgi:hypothetical protein
MTGLLVLMGYQAALLTIVVVYVMREWRGAETYRTKALRLHVKSLEADLLHMLRSGTLRKRPVVAALRNGDDALLFPSGAEA